MLTNNQNHADLVTQQEDLRQSIRDNCNKQDTRHSEVVNYVNWIAEMVNRMKATSCSQHTVCKKQEEHQCCLDHTEYAEDQKKLWDAVKDAQSLASEL